MIEAVHLAWLAQAWVKAEPHLQRAVDRSNGAFDIDHVWSEIQGNRAQLWAGDNAAVVTRIETYPSGLKSILFWICGGDDMAEVKHIEKSATEWAKTLGCTRAEIVGRRGWLKALDGYSEGSTILRRDL